MEGPVIDKSQFSEDRSFISPAKRTRLSSSSADPRSVRETAPKVNGVVVVIAVLCASSIAGGGAYWHSLKRSRPHASNVATTNDAPVPEILSRRVPQLDERSASTPTVTSVVSQPTRATDAPDPEFQKQPESDQPRRESAKEQSEREVKALERSGPASPTLTADALRTADGLKRLPELVGADFTDFRCFKDGCSMTATSPDAGSAAAAGEAIIRAKEFLYWPGPKFRSGPIPLASGQVQAVVILYRRPDSASKTRSEEIP
jgi:hypothetical protein